MDIPVKEHTSIRKLKNLYYNFNWLDKNRIEEFLLELYDLIDHWEGQFPNLRDIFLPEQINQLLTEAATYEIETTLYDFVLSCDYEDEPPLDDNRRPSLNRITALHQAGRQIFACRTNKAVEEFLIRQLFKIYSGRDVNPRDDRGVTHFHLACMTSYVDVVQEFLDIGLIDPNCPGNSTGNSPLHLAVNYNQNQVVELLLRRGANPNLTIVVGENILHVACKKQDNNYALTKIIFDIANEVRISLQIDARDIVGNTPLNAVLKFSFDELVAMVELLLLQGADTNTIDNQGNTPLHTIIKRNLNKTTVLVKKILEMSNQRVQVDARDSAERTPLQWAVAKLLPGTVVLLLNNGADVDDFIFPGENYFGIQLMQWVDPIFLGIKLRNASGIMACLEELSLKGYEVTRSDVMTIIRVLNNCQLHQMAENWQFLSSENVATKAINITADLSLYDLIQLPPRLAARQLTYRHFYDLINSEKFMSLPEGPKEACTIHLFRMMYSKFLLPWAVDPFWILIHRRLPVECCDIILSHLSIKDYMNICIVTG